MLLLIYLVRSIFMPPYPGRNPLKVAYNQSPSSLGSQQTFEVGWTERKMTGPRSSSEGI